MLQLDSLAQLAKDTTILKEVIVNVADTVTNFVYIKDVPVNEGSLLNTIINIFIAVATLLAVFVALFGERINLKLFAIKLRFEDMTIRGHHTNNKKVYICNSKIINDTKYSNAKNISIILKSIHRKKYGGEFEKEMIEAESLFIWTPKGEGETAVSFTRSRRFDFGFITEDMNYFIPELDTYYNNVNYKTRPNELVRYELEIIGDNYYGNTTIIYEVFWNGKYKKNGSNMNKNLIINNISNKDYKSPKLKNKTRYISPKLTANKYNYNIYNNRHDTTDLDGVITYTKYDSPITPSPNNLTGYGASGANEPNNYSKYTIDSSDVTDISSYLVSYDSNYEKTFKNFFKKNTDEDKKDTENPPLRSD